MTTHANRGIFLENLVERTNQIYSEKNMAIITKIPVSWKVNRAFSPYARDYKIVSAFPEKKSTVDFGGTASGFSVWFDAKAFSQKTSFPLANIHDHQIEYLKKVQEQGGKTFFLLYSSAFERAWILWLDQLLNFKATYRRKSIPLNWLEANCEEVKQGNGVILDYLPIVLGRNEGQNDGQDNI